MLQIIEFVFFFFVLLSLCSPLVFMRFAARLSVSCESVQTPRKKQRARTRSIWSCVLGSDCDCVVQCWQVISLFLFMFTALSELCQG